MHYLNLKIIIPKKCIFLILFTQMKIKLLKIKSFGLHFNTIITCT